jgi:cytochrome P450
MIGHARDACAALRDPGNLLEAMLALGDEPGPASACDVYASIITLLLAGEDTTA